MVEIWIEQGQYALAETWLKLNTSHSEVWPRTFGHPISKMVEATLCIANERWSEALETLDSLRQQGEERGHSGMLVQIHASRAYTFARMGNVQAALLAAAEAKEAGKHGNYAMSYITNGIDTRDFLTRGIPATFARPKHVYRDTPTISLRELEILKLVHEGLSNPEIADRLFISRNTVKNHLANVYDRWGISSRQDAVRMARLAGLFEQARQY